MGAVEERQDAIAQGDDVEVFRLSLEILNRKGSKRLMADEIDYCQEALAQLGKSDLLPDYFSRLSVYGQRDELNKIDPNKLGEG